MNDPRPNLSWPEFVYDLARLLRARDSETPLYLVGGAVRDACLGREVTDIDIAVDGDAIELARRVTDWLNGDIYIMDRERGVVRVFVTRSGQRLCLDFAQFRGDYLEQDLRDRDFTMNAMAVDLLGDLGLLIDPLGGLSDLRQKILRCCSARSLADDPARMLRAVRLSAQFELKIHPDAAQGMRALSAELRQVSGERARDEFFKLLGLERAARALRVLLHMNLLQTLMAPPPAGDTPHGKAGTGADAWNESLAVVERMSALLTAISSRRTDNTAATFDLGMLVIQLDRFRGSLQAHIAQDYGKSRSHGQLLILAALLHDRAPDDVASLLAALKLTVAEERKLRSAIANYRRLSAQHAWSALDQHRFWHALGAGGIDVILLAAAHYLGTAGSELKQHEWLDFVDAATTLLDTYFNQYHEIVEPALLLDGNDIRALCNLGPGPLVGELLTALREAQATGAVSSESEAADFLIEQAGRLKQLGGC